MIPNISQLPQPERRTIFVTFYSFKGGVGRTMALLNAACILAGRGRRVLMIDFDLEAPGLTSLANDHPTLRTEARSAGLVDLLTDFLQDPENSVLADTNNKAAFRDRYVYRLPIPTTLQHIENGYLDLMPCGRMDDSYESRLYSIKFDELYEEGVGLPLFQHLKNVIRESNLYDYILIDSRTGFSDEGSICTRDLADHIFVVMGLNRQNVDGTARFLERLDQSNWPNGQDGQVIFVASPVPQGQEPLVEQRLSTAHERFSRTRFPPDFRLRIPYHSRLSLDEEPFRYPWSQTDLFPAYLKIHNTLRELAYDAFPSDGAVSLIEKREFDRALTILKEGSIDDPGAVVAVLFYLANSQMDFDPELRRNAEPFFQLWLDIEGENVKINRLIRLRFGFSLLREGKYNRAKIQIDAALSGAIRYKDQMDEAFARQFMGLLYSNTGRYAEALREFAGAIEIFDGVHNIANKTATQFGLGSVYADLGDYARAQQLYDRAVEHYNAVRDNAGVARIRMATGILKVLQGNIEEGLQLLEQATLNPELQMPNDYIASGYVNYVWALERSGNVEAASLNLTEHWDFIHRWADADARYEAYVIRAKIKKAQGDLDGARKDAGIAVEYFHTQDVQTALAKEAEELAKLDSEN